MPDPIGLMQAILGFPTSRRSAEIELRRTLAAHTDPMHWCTVRFAIAPDEVMRRASAWADLPFAPYIPGEPEPVSEAPKLRHLADIRMMSQRNGDQRIAYVAPDFFGFLRLRERAAENTSLRDRLVVVPCAQLRERIIQQFGPALIDEARQRLTRHWPFATAQLDLTTAMRWGFAIGMILLAFLVLAAPFTESFWLVPTWLIAMVMPTMLRLAALATPVSAERKSRPIPDDELPVYSILIPLRDEANMVDQLCAQMASIDYPAEKLEVIFVVESRSPETIAAVRRHAADGRLSLVVVPDAMPRTKPKALNFTLPFCRGEFVVVYDAEDRPDPKQLRTMVSRFRREPELQCIQARLVIDNGEKGLLPGLFAGEYAGLFAVLLPALARWGAFMPLGGTSNHFRLEALRRLGGWDAFNVTEDADLGVRLARRGLKTSTATTFTLEYAPVQFRPWLGQRSRWLKGWMQTFMVHNRRPGALLRDLGVPAFLMFELILITMLLAPLLHLAFVPLTFWLIFQDLESVTRPTAWSAACLLMLMLGFGVTILLNMEGLRRTGQSKHMILQLLLPVYWLLISFAALVALREFVTRPFHWFKSPHQATLPDFGVSQAVHLAPPKSAHASLLGAL